MKSSSGWGWVGLNGHSILGGALVKIEENSFIIIKTYKMVKLTENYIRRLLNTSDQSNLEAIQILELRNENITSIKIDAFSSFKDLTELDLSNNRLTNIGLEFNSLENLEKLNLSNNKIKFININAFSNLVNLEMIDLSTNDLIA